MDCLSLLVCIAPIAFFWCCCTVDCTIFSDNFNRADSTTIGADWTETAGNWEIVSNKLQITTANAIITYTGINGCGGSTKASATVRSTASGDTIRVGPAELEIGTGKLRLLTAAGSVFRECNVTAAINTDYTLAVIGGDDAVIVYLDGVAYIGSGKTSYPYTNYQQLATGGTVTGTVTFDDYLIEQAYSCDHASFPSCPDTLDGCWPIVSGANPAQVSVVVSGVSGSFVCSAGECTALNGTYVLDNIGPTNAGAGYGTHLCYELTGLSLSCGAAGTYTRARLYVNTAWGATDGTCAAYFAIDNGTISDTTFTHFKSLASTDGCGSSAITLSADSGGAFTAGNGCTGGTAVCTPV